MGDLGELFQLGIPWWHLVVRAALTYVIFFIGLRLFGKRELGQFTTFDLVLVLLVANALQPAMTGPDNSITGGVIIVATLLIFNRGVAMLRSRWPAFDRLVEPPPTVLVHDGNLVKQNLDKEGLSVDDVAMAEHRGYGRWGTDNHRQLQAAVAGLEANGLDTRLDAVAVGSGMAAIAVALMSEMNAGDHLVAAHDCYGTTLTFLRNDLSRFGITATIVDFQELEAVRRAITDRTRVLLCEMCTNPLIRIPDLRALAALA